MRSRRSEARCHKSGGPVKVAFQPKVAFRPNGPCVLPARANGPGAADPKRRRPNGPTVHRIRCFAPIGHWNRRAIRRGQNGRPVGPQAFDTLASQGRWPWLGERMAHWAGNPRCQSDSGHAVHRRRPMPNEIFGFASVFFAGCSRYSPARKPGCLPNETCWSSVGCPPVSRFN